jgi:DNA polymerase-4
MGARNFTTIRKIIHIDMDAFYASVEQRDDRKLRGKPLAVGGASGRGVIAAASYEARAFGVRSAMPVRKALKLCPELLIVKPNFEKYKEISKQINEIFRTYTDAVEPLSLDEAFLDVTHCNIACNSATLIAKAIKHEIKVNLNLVASAGVSYNKFLAKIASDQDKPNGLFLITPEFGPTFVKALPIEEFFGVGNVTADKLKHQKIHKGEDLLKFSITELEMIVGKQARYFYNIARGIDHREVEADRQRKSIGAEQTFGDGIQGETLIHEKSMSIFDELWLRYKRNQLKGRTFVLKFRYANFETFTRSITFENWIENEKELRLRAIELVKENIDFDQVIRLIGYSITNLLNETESQQLVLEL